MKNKRLTKADRHTIETLLCEGRSVRYIADILQKSPSTISREINRHTTVIKAKYNNCALRHNCATKHLCKTSCHKLCSTCSKHKCSELCTDFKPYICETKQLHSLHLCNSCKKRNVCTTEKHLYFATKAERAYRNTLVGMREGFDLTYEELCHINDLVSPLIYQGQSPFHIKQVLGDELSVSESTLRRLIDKGELDARNIDLRNKVKRKVRTKRKALHNEDVLINKTGHLYSDYLAYIAENETLTVQMDCVEGTKEDNCVLLTLHFPTFHFQLAFIMPFHTSKCVVEVFDRIENAIGTALFTSLFGVILTDNGHEFSDINGMERSVNGGRRTKIFFCEPNRSDEKGSCENNHKFIRYVIPKGTSLDLLTQDEITLMMNHINSYSRKALLGKCPYDMVRNVFPNKFFDKLGLNRIAPQDVILTLALLKKHIPSD